MGVLLSSVVAGRGGEEGDGLFKLFHFLHIYSTLKLQRLIFKFSKFLFF